MYIKVENGEYYIEFGSETKLTSAQLDQLEKVINDELDKFTGFGYWTESGEI